MHMSLHDVIDFTVGQAEASETGKLLLSLGVGAGVVGGIATTGLLLLVPQLLTSDPALHATMLTVLPQVCFIYVCCCLSAASEAMGRLGPARRHSESC